jgi:hypothetical protein
MKYQSGRPGQEHHGDRREQHQQRGAEIRLQDDQRDGIARIAIGGQTAPNLRISPGGSEP